MNINIFEPYNCWDRKPRKKTLFEQQAEDELMAKLLMEADNNTNTSTGEATGVPGGNRREEFYNSKKDIPLNMGVLLAYNNRLTSLDLSRLTKLNRIELHNNLLTTASVESILTQVDNSGVVTGAKLLIINGTGNAPVNVSSSAYLSLISKGWTIQKN